MNESFIYRYSRITKSPVIPFYKKYCEYLKNKKYNLNYYSWHVQEIQDLDFVPEKAMPGSFFYNKMDFSNNIEIYKLLNLINNKIDYGHFIIDENKCPTFKNSIIIKSIRKSGGKMLNLESPKTIQECLNIQSHFVGIPKITEKNFTEFHRRGKMLQILGVGVLVKEDTNTMKRMLYLDEIKNKLHPAKNSQNLNKGK